MPNIDLNLIISTNRALDQLFDHKEIVWYWKLAHHIFFFFLLKSTCKRFSLSLSLSVTTQGLNSVRSRCSQGDWSKIACFLPLQSKWGPDRNQQRRFTPHESVIHQHRRTTGCHAASEIAFYTCAEKKEAVDIKYHKLITWLQNDLQIYFKIISNVQF